MRLLRARGDLNAWLQGAVVWGADGLRFSVALFFSGGQRRNSAQDDDQPSFSPLLPSFFLALLVAQHVRRDRLPQEPHLPGALGLWVSVRMGPWADRLSSFRSGWPAQRQGRGPREVRQGLALQRRVVHQGCCRRCRPLAGRPAQDDPHRPSRSWCVSFSSLLRTRPLTPNPN